MYTKYNQYNKRLQYRVFLHDDTVAILVSQNNEKVAMLLSPTNPLGVELREFSELNFLKQRFLLFQ